MPETSQRYLHGHHDSVLRSHRWRTAENSAGYLLGELTPAARILDIGCGPGTITADLAARVPDGVVIGLDAAAGVLASARENAEKRGLGNVRFEIGDAYHLAFADSSFDVVHAHQVLQHLADPVAALRQMRRVCRPSGIVAVRDADYGGMFWYPRDPELDEWQELYRRVARAMGGELDGGRHLLAWARAAGLTDVRTSASAWCYAAPDDSRWWGQLWAERVTSSSFAGQAIELNLASRPDLERLASAWLRWSAEPDAWFLVPNGEILARVRET